MAQLLSYKPWHYKNCSDHKNCKLLYHKIANVTKRLCVQKLLHYKIVATVTKLLNYKIATVTRWLYYKIVIR